MRRDSVAPIPKSVRTGRRFAAEIDSPRDRTVCFMVSEEEKQTIDEIGMAVGLTRSATLAKVVVSFITAVTDPETHIEAWKDLEAFLGRCRERMSSPTPHNHEHTEPQQTNRP